MAFCTNCGTKIENGGKFCPNCGASVEGEPQPPKTAPESAPHAAAALEKALPMLKRNYKLIGIAAVAVGILLLILARCSGGGKEDNFLDQIRGYWTMKTQVYSDSTMHISRPRDIGITDKAVQLGANQSPCPMSETEYKDGALYFSAQWYQSFPSVGREAGMQNYDLRLTYDKSSDLLILELEVPGGWDALGEYARAD